MIRLRAPGAASMRVRSHPCPHRRRPAPFHTHLVLRVAPASENFAPPRRARAREDVREELRRADALSLAVHESAKASQHIAILLIVLYKVDKQTQHRRLDQL